jgi:hypothetical protein
MATVDIYLATGAVYKQVLGATYSGKSTWHHVCGALYYVTHVTRCIASLSFDTHWLLAIRPK